MLTDIAAIVGAVLSTILAISELFRGRPKIEICGVPIGVEESFPREIQVRILNTSDCKIYIDRYWLSYKDLHVFPENSSAGSAVRSAMNQVFYNKLYISIPSGSDQLLTFGWPNGVMPPDRLPSRLIGAFFWHRSNGGFFPTFPVFFQIGNKSYRAIMNDIR